jgi:hypothetical protein
MDMKKSEAFRYYIHPVLSMFQKDNQEIAQVLAYVEKR